MLSAQHKGESGWIPWDWSLNKWMWGAMDRKDAEEINRQLRLNQEAVREVNTRVITLTNQSLSVMKTVNDVLNNRTKELLIQIKSVAKETSNWAQDVARTVSNLTTESKASSFLMMGSPLLIQSSQVRSQLTALTGLISNINAHNSKVPVESSVAINEFPERLIIDSDLLQGLSLITSSKPESLRVVPHKSARHLFKTLRPSCLIYSQYGIFLFQVPLVSSLCQMSTWAIQALPIQVGNLGMVLDSQYEGINIDIERGVWQGFTRSELALCFDNGLPICPFYVFFICFSFLYYYFFFF